MLKFSDFSQTCIESLEKNFIRLSQLAWPPEAGASGEISGISETTQTQNQQFFVHSQFESIFGHYMDIKTDHICWKGQKTVLEIIFLAKMQH